MADYTLSVNIKGDSEEFKRALKAAQDAVDGFEKKTSSVSQKMMSVGDKMAGIGAKMTIGLTTPLVLGGKAAVTAASDYEENLNKIDVAFGKSGKAVKEWSETATKQFGLSKNQALEAAALFGDMATSMGLTKPAAADMSVSLTGLAGDLASFKNIGIDQAMTALAGVFTGETESLKQLGIVMTETNLEEFASKTGLVYSEMSQAKKVQLRYNYVMAMSKNAIGDYARTSDGTANSIRTFKSSVENLGIAFGKELLPVVTPVIQKATDMIEAFGDLSPETKELTVKLGLLAASMGPVTAIAGKTISAAGKLSEGFGTLRDVLGKTGTGTKETSGAMGTFANVMNSSVGKFGIGAVAIGGLVSVLKNAYDEAHKASQAADEFGETCKERVADVQAQGAEIDVLYKRLQTLSSVENKNQAQKDLMKQTVEQLNSSVEGLNLQYDSEKDKLNMTTDALKEKIDAQKQSMLVDAYMENSKAAMEEYAKNVAEVTDLETKRAEQQDKLNNLIASNSDLTDVNRGKIKEVQKELQTINADIADNTEAMFKNMQEATKYSNLATMDTEAWKKLGLEIPENIAKGIKDGSYVVPQSTEELQSLITFDKAVDEAGLAGSTVVQQLQIGMANGMPVAEATDRLNAIIDFQKAADNAGLKGSEIVESLSNSMASGEVSIQEGTQRMNDIITFQQAATRAGLEGDELVTALSTSIASGDISVTDAAKKLTDATGAQLDLASAAAKKSGKNTKTSYASGLESGLGGVVNAAAQVANTATSNLKGDGYTPGSNITRGVAAGMRDGSAMAAVTAAANAIVATAMAAVNTAAIIRSPSHLFEDESGVYMTMGVASGMLKGIPTVKTAGTEMVAAAEDAVLRAQKGLSFTADGNMTYTFDRHISQDMAVHYANSNMVRASAVEPLDMYSLGNYIISAVTQQGEIVAQGIEKGIGEMRLVADGRETARFIAGLGFRR